MKKILALVVMLNSLAVMAATKVDLIVGINAESSRHLGFLLGSDKAWGSAFEGKYKFKVNAISQESGAAKIHCQILDTSRTEKREEPIVDVETLAPWGKPTEVVKSVEGLAIPSQTTFTLKFTAYKIQ